VSETVEIGSGTVVIAGKPTEWDRIELLPNGVLRVARTVKWTAVAGITYAAESAVEYLAAGTWSQVRPDSRRNGTVVVHIGDWPPEVVGTCLTEVQALQAAAEYLRANYSEPDWYIDRIGEHFGYSAPRIQLKTREHNSTLHTLHFEWVLPPSAPQPR
jgi:hypothetical protein